jgi:hypothetical protein
MHKQWDSWMVGFAGALVGLLASVGHIIASRAVVDSGPVPIGQVPLYVLGVAAAFGMVSAIRNRLVKRRREFPAAGG